MTTTIDNRDRQFAELAVRCETHIRNLEAKGDVSAAAEISLFVAALDNRRTIALELLANSRQKLSAVRKGHRQLQACYERSMGRQEWNWRTGIAVEAPSKFEPREISEDPPHNFAPAVGLSLVVASGVMTLIAVWHFVVGA